MYRNIKLVLIIYASSIIVFGGIIPFYFVNCNKLSVSLDIIKTISILAGSILALSYFDPGGLWKKNKEKQYENVIQILQKCLGDKILFDLNLGNGRMVFFSFISKDNVKNSNIDAPLVDNFKLPLAFDNDNFQMRSEEFLKLRHNLWTPPEIAEILDFFHYTTGQKLTKSFKEVVFITFGYKTIIDRQDYLFYHDEEPITVGDLFVFYRTLIDACEKWLKDNSYSNKSLNI